MVRGYWLNQAFNALRDPAARARWRDDLEAYLAEFPLTDAERQLVLDGDWAGCIDAGASVYTLTKVGATADVSLLYMGAQMRGQTMAEFTAFLTEQNERMAQSAIPFTRKAGSDG